MDWKVFVQNNESSIKQLKATVVDDHPLKPNVVERMPRKILGSLPSTGKTTPIASTGMMLDLNAVLEGLDPLSKFTIAEMDPLSQMATNLDTDKVEVKSKENLLDIEPWSSRKQAILSKYTTSERLCIITTFLPDSDKVIVKAQTASIDKIQHRLEQLDCIEEGSQKKAYLSQIEYMAQIEQLNKELVLAWNTNQRVKALKIAIQCAKFLSDTDVLNFYPSKFVLITEILDTFGSLVYDRLHTKSNVALPDNFTADIVPESTKETCRNWFYKIASIRELVPRIYMEMAILKSYKYLTSSDYSATLLRLTKMIRGIGNPLVAVYARCYLCRIGVSVSAVNTKYLLENFYDFLEGYKNIIGRNIKHISKQNINISDYMPLYIPALEFILQAAVHNRSETLLDVLLQKCLKQSNYFLLLYIIMSSFKKNVIAQKCFQFLDAMEQESGDAFPKHLLLKTLGNCMCDAIPPTECRKLILNYSWKQISAINEPGEYITCVDAWIQFTVKNFNSKEVNKVISDIIRHMTPRAAYENHYNMLKVILEKIMFDMNDFEIVFSMENFLPFIDLFQQENLRIDVCKNILTSCNTDQKTYDPVIINALMFLCNILHDSVNALTVEDERRQIGELIAGVIRRVDYGRDFEQQLSYYVESRGAFTNIDIVLAQLVQCVNSLSVQTRQIVKGHHTRKTGAFVRACAAYCFITVPSIGSVKTRLELYLLSARVALFNNCLSQADACLKAALPLIPELCSQEERNYETYITSYICNFMSTLLVVPDSPTTGVLTLTRSLLNTLQETTWNKQETVVQLYLYVLDLLSAMAQENYPYHVDKVESNDNLYGLDTKFLREIDKISTIIISEILSNLKKIGPSTKQASYALDILTRVATKGDLQDDGMKLLGTNLWNLNLKYGHADLKHAIKLKDLLKRHGELNQNNTLLIFVESLKLVL